MKMNLKKSMIILLILTLTLTLAGCSGEKAAEKTSAGISVTDMSGQEITLDAPAEKVVALTASDCEILYALGAGDTIVGRGEYCDYPEEVLDVKSVKSGSDTNVEEIIALEPQIVIMSNMDQTDEQIAAIRKAGIQVAVSDAQDIEGVYTAIEMIGKLTGKDSEAVGLVSEMRGTFDQIKGGGNSGEEKTVYFEVSPLEYGLWTAGGDTFMDEIAAMAGLKNIFSDVSGWVQVSQEQVIDRDPDYIVAVPMSYSESPKTKEEIMGRKGWQNMKAVKNGAIYVANSDEITRPGPRLAKAASSLYDFIYGESENQ